MIILFVNARRMSQRQIGVSRFGAARARLIRLGVVAIGCGLLATLPLRAQGSISGLGFGYPLGGNSVRTSGTGGAFTEFDPLSPVNPASLGGLSRIVLGVQAEPEYRTVRTGEIKEKTTVQRIPLLAVIFPASEKIAVALSANTFLDRSFNSETSGQVIFQDVTLNTFDRSEVRGSIADLRAALGWKLNERFSVGFGAHLLTGDNLVVVTRTFNDSVRFGRVVDSSRVEYLGTALSVGGEWRVRKGLAAQLSYRAGNSIEARIRDTVRTKANVPDRIGVGVRFDGIPGSVFAISVDQAQWSQMRGLGSDLVVPHNTLSWHVGGEFAGPHLGSTNTVFRAGFAKNELPFGVGSAVASESRMTFGLGLPFARELAVADFSLQRASRSLAGSSSRETAWLLGFGIQIRP